MLTSVPMCASTASNNCGVAACAFAARISTAIVCRAQIERSSPWQKSGRLKACPTLLRKLWIQVGGAGGFACDFDTGGLPRRPGGLRHLLLVMLHAVVPIAALLGVGGDLGGTHQA